MGDSTVKEPCTKLRRQVNWKVFEIGLISGAGAKAACVVDTLSPSFALVSADYAPVLGESLKLEIVGFGTIPATVVGKSDSLLELTFQFELDQSAQFEDWLVSVKKEYHR